MAYHFLPSIRLSSKVVTLGEDLKLQENHLYFARPIFYSFTKILFL